MASLPVFVGLDYHMVFVQVCVMLSCGRVLANFRCRNEWCEIATRVAVGVSADRRLTRRSTATKTGFSNRA